MAAQAQRAATAAALQKQAPVNIVNTNVNANANANANRNRGRTQIMTKPMPSGPIIKPNQINPHMAANMLLPANFQLTNAGQFIQVSKIITYKISAIVLINANTEGNNFVIHTKIIELQKLCMG